MKALHAVTMMFMLAVCGWATNGFAIPRHRHHDQKNHMEVPIVLSHAMGRETKGLIAQEASKADLKVELDLEEGPSEKKYTLKIDGTEGNEEKFLHQMTQADDAAVADAFKRAYDQFEN